MEGRSDVLQRLDSLAISRRSPSRCTRSWNKASKPSRETSGARNSAQKSAIQNGNCRIDVFFAGRLAQAEANGAFRAGSADHCLDYRRTLRRARAAGRAARRAHALEVQGGDELVPEPSFE